MENQKRHSVGTPVRKEGKSLNQTERTDRAKSDRTGSNRTRSGSANWPIALLPGLRDQDQTRLQNSGIHTTLQLLQRTQTPAQKQALASHLQIHLQYVNKWVALADLARIPAVGCQNCGLLLHAGISSPAQLVQTPLYRLHRQILKLQVATMQRQDLCPSLDEISRWIGQAQKLCGQPQR